MKDLLRTGGSGILLLLIMVGGGVVLWIGVPLMWLYIGSLVQGETSLGVALAVTMVGVLASILVIVAILGWLGRKHADLREARGREHHGQTALEAVMTVSAGLALVAFSAWFFLFSGTSPVPTSLGF